MWSFDNSIILIVIMIIIIRRRRRRKRRRNTFINESAYHMYIYLLYGPQHNMVKQQ